MTISSGQQALAADVLKHATASGHLRLAASTELTIASGAVTANANFYRVDTEGDAASDDLDTITVGSEVADGFLLFLRAENAARTVVIKHNTGNILCVGNNDISLDDSHDWVLLIYDGNLTKWLATFLTPPSQTRRFLVPVTGKNTATSAALAHVTTLGLNMASGSDSYSAHGFFFVPDDFLSGMSVAALVSSSNSGNAYVDLYAAYGAVGEANNTHEVTVAAAAVAVTSSRSSICSASLTSAAKGDQVGVMFSRETGHALDTVANLYVKGFLVSYTADS